MENIMDHELWVRFRSLYCFRTTYVNDLSLRQNVGAKISVKKQVVPLT
jgi:hypothetical protein